MSQQPTRPPAAPARKRTVKRTAQQRADIAMNRMYAVVMSIGASAVRKDAGRRPALAAALEAFAALEASVKALTAEPRTEPVSPVSAPAPIKPA
jgi:hypothetical protein